MRTKKLSRYLGEKPFLKCFWLFVDLFLTLSIPFYYFLKSKDTFPIFFHGLTFKEKTRTLKKIQSWKMHWDNCHLWYMILLVLKTKWKGGRKKVLFRKCLSYSILELNKAKARYKQITDEEDFEFNCVKFMFRELFPRIWTFNCLLK